MSRHTKPFGTASTFEANNFDSIRFSRQPVQTQNNGLTELSTHVAPAFNIILGQNSQIKELRVEDYAANPRGSTTGAMGFGINAQQASVIGAPAAPTIAFSFGGNQSKLWFGTTGTKRGSATGVMGTGSPARQTSVLGYPAESVSAFPLGGNQSKPLFATTEVKRERETSENKEESTAVKSC